jgi:hypothetical protein
MDKVVELVELDLAAVTVDCALARKVLCPTPNNIKIKYKNHAKQHEK